MSRQFGRRILALIAIVTCVRSVESPALPADKVFQKQSTQVLAEEAKAQLSRQDWSKAVAALAPLVRVNPYSGQHWYEYALALHSLKRHDEAIKAWDESVKLGFQPTAALYNIACANSLAGHTDEAIASLQKALDAGFAQEASALTDPDLAPIRSDPRFKQVVGTQPEGLSRTERWNFDLDYLIRRMERVHYNLYARVSREVLRGAIDDLKGRIATLKDEEIAVGVQRILALVGDGHTISVWRPQHDEPLLRYSVELYLYKEGLFVRAAAPEYQDIVGSKVLKIGNLTAEEALATVEPLCSRDNPMGVKLQSPLFLTNPHVLSYLKISENTKNISLTVKTPAGKEVRVDLKPIPLNRAATAKFVRANWSSKSSEPISFKQNDNPFWFEYLADKKVVYFQFNAVANRPDETLKEFCGRLFGFISEHPVETLIVDMRNNGGGNTLLTRPLLHGLIRAEKANRRGHLFVLVGRRTFSAAMNCTVGIERNTDAIFVGEPTGSSPNFVGESTMLQLPCSKLRLTCSSLYWQSSLPMDRRTWIAPELVAEPSIEAFAANRDPGLEAIFAYLDSQAPPAKASPSVSPSQATSLRQIVEECNRKVIADFKRGDMLAVARSYADDATIYFGRGQEVHGRHAIDRYWQMVKGAKDWKLEAIEVGGTPAAIYEIGKSSLTTEVNGKGSTYVCDYVVIWKRQKDGTYRTHSDIFN
ncbi:MAG TPA: tetratricopeptide repeat protein [Planctomycetaceae bacterium]|jgi:ketosteroid isomerase-like protein/tetratricopeptide (TPR) repeat protein|nr:tetratricopeptide repeat protein [Planctomycetaceae bacterium]